VAALQKNVEIVVNGLTLRGMMHIPDTGKDKYPFVAMYHGFTGSKTEAGFKFVQLSRRLEEAGIGSLRFDFSGSGESDGTFDQMTIKTEAEEAKMIFKYMSGLEIADEKNLFMLGFSMGGLVTSITSPVLQNVKAIVLWAPAGNMSAIAEEIFEKSRTADGRVEVGGLLLNPNFLEELKKIDVYEMAKGYTGDVLMIHGTEDTAVPIFTSKEYLKAYGEKARLVEIQGADHIFSRIEWGNTLLDATVDFIKQHVE